MDDKLYVIQIRYDNNNFIVPSTLKRYMFEIIPLFK